MPIGTHSFSTIDSVVMRISRLDGAGNPLFGNASGALVFCCSAMTTLTPNVTTGAEVKKEGYCAGKVCNRWTTPDYVDSYAGELTICNESDQLNDLLNSAEQLNFDTGGQTELIGSLFYQQDGCQVDAQDDNGVTIEMWSRPIACDSQAVDTTGVLLWRKLVIPRAFSIVPTSTDGANGTALTEHVWTYKTKRPGLLWGNGPFNDSNEVDNANNPLAPAAQNWIYAEYFTTTAPPECSATGEATFVPIPANVL